MDRAIWERERIETLRQYEILDTPPEEAFDRIVRIAAQVASCPIAMVSLIDERRQWIKAAFGISLCEGPRFEAFCDQAIALGDTLVVENALFDDRFSHLPLVLSSPEVRFYAGVPIRAKNGLPLGTLCVIDKKARQLGAQEREALGTLAREVEEQLELRRVLRQVLRVQKGKDELSALLVHDLRSPLTAILATARSLELRPDLDPALRGQVSDMLSSGRSMLRMVRNLLDVARSDRGELEPVIGPVPLRQLFEAAVAATRQAAAGTGRRLDVALSLRAEVLRTDGDLLRRIFENLLDNALKHAPEGTAVELSVSAAEAGPIRARVVDRGPGVPPARREEVFGLHAQLDPSLPRAGYGMGLYFCRLAAEVLSGRVWVEDAEPGAAFCLEVPAAAPPVPGDGAS